MGAPQYEQAGADIGGTGTIDTIPRWTGASTLGDSLLSQSGAIVTNSGTFRTADGSNTEPGYTFTNSSGSGMYRGASGTVLRFASSGTFAFGVSTSQNVLIGGSATSTPARKLTVENNQPLRLGTATEYWDFVQNTTNVWGWLSNAGQYSILMNNTNGFVGIGTASPGYRLHVKDATNRNMIMTSGTTGMKVTSLTDAGAEADIGVQGNTVQFLTGGTERARIDSSGNLILNTASTGATIQAAGSQQGLKLPATPGNADTQTLDAYQENTWTPTLTGFGGTTPTATIARYTRVGRLVTVHVLLTATGGNQFSSTAATTLLTLPSGITPAADAAGSTSNSVIGADGPCVAYTNGNLYVPTFALRTANTILTVTYSV